MSIRFSERSHFKNENREQLRKTSNVSLWPPHVYMYTHTCTHACMHTHTHTNACTHSYLEVHVCSFFFLYHKKAYLKSPSTLLVVKTGVNGFQTVFGGLDYPDPAWKKLYPKAVPLLHTDWHANPIALGVQQAPNLSEVAVSLPIVLIHGGLQQEGVVGIQHPGNSFLRALHKHTRLLGVHIIPHALVGLIPGILGKDQKEAGVGNETGNVGFKRKGIQVSLCGPFCRCTPHHNQPPFSSCCLNSRRSLPLHNGGGTGIFNRR